MLPNLPVSLVGDTQNSSMVHKNVRKGPKFDENWNSRKCLHSGEKKLNQFK
jgi:hypothetical protein